MYFGPYLSHTTPPSIGQMKSIFVLTIILASQVGDLVPTLKMSSCYGLEMLQVMMGAKPNFSVTFALVFTSLPDFAAW